MEKGGGGEKDEQKRETVKMNERCTEKSEDLAKVSVKKSVNSRHI